MRPPAIEEQVDVCIIGMGYVGLTLATALAASGQRVVGVEQDPAIVTQLHAGRATFYESGLSETLAEVVASGHLRGAHADSGLPAARAYIITVGTPIEDHSVRTADLSRALAQVAQDMPPGSLVVLRSTVALGTTAGMAHQALAASGKPFHLAMAPERTVEGNALHELSHLPQIVGGIDAASGKRAGELFARLGVEIVQVPTPAEAELAKLVSNTWRDVQFAFANEMAFLADHAGIDVAEAFAAAGHNYPRVSLARPGPVAGPCLGKDGYILAESAHHLGGRTDLSVSARAVNERIVSHVLSEGARILEQEPGQVAIIGLAFKGRPATSDLRGTLARDFAAAAAQRWPTAHVVGYDPVVPPEAAATLPLTPVASPVAAASELVILQTNHTEFSSPNFLAELAAHLPEGAVVLDLWDQTSPLATARPDLRIKPLGRPLRTPPTLEE